MASAIGGPELAVDLRRALVADRARPCRRSRRGRRSAAASAGAPSKPSGYSSAMKPVVRSPERKRGCCISAERKSTLWPMPSIDERVERGDLRVDRRLARRRPGDQLGDHRVVEHADLAAFERRRRRRGRDCPLPLAGGVEGMSEVAPFDRRSRPSRSREAEANSAPAARCSAGTRDTGPRHRPASRPPSRRASRRPA